MTVWLVFYNQRTALKSEKQISGFNRVHALPFSTKWAKWYNYSSEYVSE